jgi:hypothetical protein
MRLWSLHPKYLDSKGLVALWREALLAKHVLEGKTTAYKNHPQLTRFKTTENPIDAINQYLFHVHHEAIRRKYSFNEEKFNLKFKAFKLSLTNQQLNFEKIHLLSKLQTRDPEKFLELQNVKKTETHPLFEIIRGEIEKWEIISDISLN